MADENGLDALSMRALASSLGVEAMSLYRHVVNKDDLLDGIVDLVVNEIWLPKETTDWQEAMRRRAISAHEVLLRHPWALALIESRSKPSTVRLAYTNAVLGILRTAGLTAADAYRAFITIDAYVYGFALQEANWTQESNDANGKHAWERQLNDGEHPHLTAAYESFFESHKLPIGRGSTFESEFEFGLDLILEGLARLCRR